jgi:hypothetical protein
MFKTSIIIDDDVLSEVREQARRSPGLMAAYIRTRVVPHIERRVDETIARYPGAVSRPFQFATPKSRRAYFATDGFGKGIPYQRTGATAQAWRVDFDFRERDGGLSIVNTADHAVYLYGAGDLLTNRQQVPGHSRTGWGDGMDDAVLDISTEATDMVIDGWGEIFDAV